MDDRQSAKLKMYINVQGVINKNNSLWQNIAAYGQAYSIFVTNMLSIDQLNEQLQSGSQGTTLDKSRLKEAMAEQAILVVSILKAYTAATHNVGLARDMDFSYSSIAQAKDTDADDICRHILKKGGEHIAALGNFGLTQADLNGLQQTIEQFTAAIGKPKAAITQIKNLNEQMSALFRANDKLLSEQLDNLMARFKFTHVNFYNEYFSVRTIEMQGSRPVKDSKGELIKK